MANAGRQYGLGVADSSARPGTMLSDLRKSRAAARALLERRFAGRKRLDVVSSIPRTGGDGGMCDDGSLFRCSQIPPGMTVEGAERIAAQRSEA